MLTREVELAEQLRTPLRDPFHLPTLREIRAAFPPSNGRVDSAWRDFCLKQDPEFLTFYDLINKELIAALARYLQERADIYGGTPENPTRVVEVGAGDGRMAHFLRKNLSKAVTYLATDSGDWSIPAYFPADVELGIDYLQALQRYQPTIVVVSWMPEGVDWTPDFRRTKRIQTKRIQEYLLMGPTDGDCCGNALRTWGKAYENDGFTRVDLPDISQFQICFKDSSPYQNSISKTVSFRRW